MKRVFAARARYFGVAACTAVLSCSATPDDGGWDDPGAGASGAAGAEPSSPGGGGAAGGVLAPEAGVESNPSPGCAEAAKLVYLVSRTRGLYAFDPTIDGLGAYVKRGDLTCPSSGTPGAMTVDRSGKAYVFYGPGELFLVDTQTAACTPTAYQHPASGSSMYTLGMSFTADTSGSASEVLFAGSPDVGLYTIDPLTFSTSLLGVHQGVATDVTGGPDGKLFYFLASNKTIYELDRSGGYAMTEIGSFAQIQQDIHAWAFTRYAGVFYLFTASSGNTRTTRFDPVTHEVSTRDADIGFAVVGAGQSTCVPAPVK